MSKKWFITLFIVAVLCGLTAFMTPALASSEPAAGITEQASPLIEVPSGDYDIFLRLDGVLGESVNSNHKDWIDVVSFNWGLSMPAATTSTGGASATRAQVMDFSFSHLLDKASPKLMTSCAGGMHIKSATLELCMPEHPYSKFYQLVMTDVSVTKVYLAGDDALPMTENATSQFLPLGYPMEDVTLSFSKIEWTYWVIDNKGKVGGTINGSLDLKTNIVR